MKMLRLKVKDRVSLAYFIKAERLALRGKRKRGDILRYMMNSVANLCLIREAVLSGNYHTSKYKSFWIHDPKDRLILSLPIADRIVHQWLVEEFIKPYFIPRFIHDSYACIPGRGSHAAVRQVQHYRRAAHAKWGDGYYFLKMDIHKFFDSIDRDILFAILVRQIADLDLLKIIHAIIYENNPKLGLPIGNYTSQYFANIYLNELDQYCKHQLHLEYYVRYMDDFIIIVKDKQEAERIFHLVDEFVQKRLHLQLNPKSAKYPRRKGIDFVGYIIYEDYMLIRHRSKRKIGKIIRAFKDGSNNEQLFRRRVTSWLGHVMHANSYRYAVTRLYDYLPWFGRLLIRDQ